MIIYTQFYIFNTYNVIDCDPSNRHWRAGISHEQSLLMRPHSQCHRTVGQHLRISFPHLQFPLHFFSQFQLTSNEHTMLISSRTVHLGLHTFVSSLRIQLHSETSGYVPYVLLAFAGMSTREPCRMHCMCACRVVEELIGWEGFFWFCTCLMIIVIF